MLCSLSNFDVYHATRPHRAPKPFTFTVKSTEKLSLFENTDDYMHTFSCSERDGNIWMEKILVARVRNFSSELLAELILVTPVLRASSGTTYPVWTSTRWQQRLSSPWPLSCRDEENVVRSSPCTTPRQFAALPSRIRTTLVPERCI